MLRSFLPPAASRLALAVLGAVVLLGLLPGCGHGDRQKAREKIRQANHSFTVDDFIKAAAAGDQPLLEAFLEGGMDKNAQDKRGFTALMAAAQAGKIDLAKALLDENAKPDVQNKEGATALIVAAAADQPGAVRTLIEANADVRSKDRKNWTALMKAVYEGKDRVVDVLLATSRDQLMRDKQLDRALAVAALLGNDGIVRQLLDHGANVNATIENHQTALMYAAIYGKQATAELLLERQADPKLINSDGASASILALQQGHPELSKLIDSHTPGSLPPVGSSAAAAAGSPLPLPDGAAKQVAADAASVASDRNFLKDNGLDQAAGPPAKDLGDDDDHDGFTNEEEIAAGTNPKDAASHPPAYAKLRLKRVVGDSFPVIFDGVEGKKVHVTVRESGSDLPDGKAERKLEVTAGERIGELPYVVSRVARRDTSEKDTGRPLDLSELTLSNIQTGRKVVLVKSMPTNSPDAGAVLSSGRGQPELTVKQGEQFSLPGDAQTRYEVIDIRPTQVILKIVGGNQTITVPAQ